MKTSLEIQTSQENNMWRCGPRKIKMSAFKRETGRSNSNGVQRGMVPADTALKASGQAGERHCR